LHGLVLFSGGTLLFFWLLLMLADYGWEQKKRHGLDAQSQNGRQIQGRKRSTYGWYSWARYLAMILLTYINAIAIMNSEPQKDSGLVSSSRMFWLFLIVILLAIALLTIDGYWDRRRRDELRRAWKVLFWLYFWIRYPVLVIATVQLTRMGLQP
jgi:hypothetical protein